MEQLVKTSKFALIERLASALAHALLQLDRVTRVRVRLAKPAAPIPDFPGKIAVEITREKT